MGYFLDYELFQECVNCGRTTCNGNECRQQRPRYTQCADVRVTEGPVPAAVRYVSPTQKFANWSDSALIAHYGATHDMAALAELERRAQGTQAQVTPEFVAAVKADEERRPLLAPVLGMLFALVLLSGCGWSRSRAYASGENPSTSSGQAPAAETVELPAAPQPVSVGGCANGKCWRILDN